MKFLQLRRKFIILSGSLLILTYFPFTFSQQFFQRIKAFYNFTAFLMFASVYHLKSRLVLIPLNNLLLLSQFQLGFPNLLLYLFQAGHDLLHSAFSPPDHFLIIPDLTLPIGNLPGSFFFLSPGLLQLAVDSLQIRIQKSSPLNSF